MLILASRLYAEEYRQSAEVLFSFGEAYLKENRYGDAKTELRKCLMLNPNHQGAKQILQQLEEKTAKSEEKIVKREEKPVKPEEEPVKFTKNESREKAIKLALEEAKKRTLGEKVLEKESPPITPAKEKTPILPSERVAWALKQGTWQLKQGDFYGELYSKYYWHKDKFDDKGNKKNWDYEGKYNEIRTELKLEYGLSDKYTLMLYTVAKEAHWKDSLKSSTRKGFVEMWPGIKYLLFDDPFLCWLRLRTKFPLHYSEEAVPAIGTHQIDEEIKLLTAQPWPKLPGYTKFELGFKARAEEPSNEIIYFTQLGYDLIENIILELTLEGQKGVGGGIQEDWIKGTFGPIFKVGLLNIKFGYGNTFAGKNTSAADEVYLSVYTFW